MEGLGQLVLSQFIPSRDCEDELKIRPGLNSCTVIANPVFGIDYATSDCGLKVSSGGSMR